MRGAIQEILLDQGRASRDSGPGASGSALCCPVWSSGHPLRSPLHTFGSRVASGSRGSPPATLSRTVPAQCQVRLPVSLDLKSTFPEGNLISLAGQVPPVDPNSRGGEVGRHPVSGGGRAGAGDVPGSAASEGLAGRGSVSVSSSVDVCPVVVNPRRYIIIESCLGCLRTGPS